MNDYLNVTFVKLKIDDDNSLYLDEEEKRHAMVVIIKEMLVRFTKTRKVTDWVCSSIEKNTLRFKLKDPKQDNSTDNTNEEELPLDLASFWPSFYNFFNEYVVKLREYNDLINQGKNKEAKRLLELDSKLSKLSDYFAKIDCDVAFSITSNKNDDQSVKIISMPQQEKVAHPKLGKKETLEAFKARITRPDYIDEKGATFVYYDDNNKQNEAILSVSREMWDDVSLYAYEKVSVDITFEVPLNLKNSTKKDGTLITIHKTLEKQRNLEF